jgi:hypothetical protein
MSNPFEQTRDWYNDPGELPRGRAFGEMSAAEIENLQPRPIPSGAGAYIMPQGGLNMNGRPLPSGWDPSGSGISWLPAVGSAISAGVGVYNAIWGDESSGKGESVAETSTAEWYTDMPYSSGVPTQRQLGMHGHPHPRGLVHRRRRRRKLLTASDKADIAFITGTLGKGEMGRTAIAALLSRRMS